MISEMNFVGDFGSRYVVHDESSSCLRTYDANSCIASSACSRASGRTSNRAILTSAMTRTVPQCDDEHDRGDDRRGAVCQERRVAGARSVVHRVAEVWPVERVDRAVVADVKPQLRPSETERGDDRGGARRPRDGVDHGDDHERPESYE